MRFRLGLLIGFVAGYVLGARAGRERYEQILRVSAEVRRHPAVAQLAEQATALSDAYRALLADGLSAAAQVLRERSRPHMRVV